MRTTAEIALESTIVRFRGNSCIICSLAPPFVTGYWPDVTQILSSTRVSPASCLATEPKALEQLLKSMGNGLLEKGTLSSRHLEFHDRPEDIRAASVLREGAFWIRLLGRLNRLAVPQIVRRCSSRINPGGKVTVAFDGGGECSQWASLQESISDVLSYLYNSLGLEPRITFTSDLLQIPEGLWEFMYDRPALQLKWTGTLFADCDSAARLERMVDRNVTLKNLSRLSNEGLSVNVTLPATKQNATMLHDIVLVLTEITRGAKIEVLPISIPTLLPGNPAPLVSEVRRSVTSDLQRRTHPSTLGFPSVLGSRAN